jgi:hypothetical protein
MRSTFAKALNAANDTVVLIGACGARDYDSADQLSLDLFRQLDGLARDYGVDLRVQVLQRTLHDRVPTTRSTYFAAALAIGGEAVALMGAAGRGDSDGVLRVALNLACALQVLHIELTMRRAAGGEEG